MWARNLLFVGLLLVGAVVLSSNLAPAPRPEQWEGFQAGQFERPEFRGGVDRLNAAIEAEWANQALSPAARADDLTIARRVSLALTGTIPSLEEIRMFQRRPEEGRIAWWTRGLLADRRSADYLAERLARTYVGTNMGPFVLYRRNRFVTWLSDQLAQNRPYDEVVRDLVATDGLWTDHPATNFITAAIKPDSDEGVQENVMAARVSRAFLGFRLDCAECHDHPFDDWKQTDFQGLAAFFGKIDVKDGRALAGIRDYQDVIFEVEDRETLEKHAVEAAVPFHAELLPAEGLPRKRLAVWVTHKENEMFSRALVNRVWALCFGRPLVEPIDNIPHAGEVPAVLDLLAKDFVANDYDLQHLIHTIVASDAFQLESAANPAIEGHEITEEMEAAWACFPLTRLRPEQASGSLLQAGSVATLDYQSHILVRIARLAAQNEFVQRYGDTGEDEFTDRGGTIPQRLLVANGELVKKQTEPGLLAAASQIAQMAPTDAAAVETAYLVVLTRRPTPEEEAHFVGRLAGSAGGQRNEHLEDLYWTLINSTEFSWNH